MDTNRKIDSVKMKFPWIEIIISFKSIEMKMYIVLKKYLQSFRLLIKFVESSKKNIVHWVTRN